MRLKFQSLDRFRGSSFEYVPVYSYPFQMRGETLCFHRWGQIKLLKVVWEILPSNWPKMRLNITSARFTRKAFWSSNQEKCLIRWCSFRYTESELRFTSESYVELRMKLYLVVKPVFSYCVLYRHYLFVWITCMCCCYQFICQWIGISNHVWNQILLTQPDYS